MLLVGMVPVPLAHQILVQGYLNVISPPLGRDLLLWRRETLFFVYPAGTKSLSISSPPLLSHVFLRPLADLRLLEGTAFSTSVFTSIPLMY